MPQFKKLSRVRSAALKRRRPRLESLERRAMLAGDVYEVLNLNDEGAGSLREAIELANTNEGKDTIVFARGTRGEIQLSEELTITDDLVIRGPGSDRLTISGQDLTRVFRIDATPNQLFGASVDESGNPLSLDVSIYQVTIADGLATDAPGFPYPLPGPDGAPVFPRFGFGGGLYNRGNDVDLVGVHFEDNQAGSNVLPISGSGEGATYEQLTGEYSGPVGSSNLGPILVDGKVDLPVTPTLFNPQPSEPGEVFFRAPFSGSQTVTDTNGDVLAGNFTGEVVFKLNELGQTTGEWDAAFEIDPEASTGRFDGATGTLQIVAFNPPGFDPFEATLPFDWTIDGELNLPNDGAAGGAVANEFGGDLSIRDGHFENNSAQGIILAGGGAVTSDLGPTIDGGTTAAPTVSIKDSSFVGNTAQAQIGAITAVDENGQPLFAFSGLGTGGAILNVTGALTVTDSKFEGNIATGGTAVAGIPGLPDSNEGGAGQGGAIASSDISPFGTAESTLLVKGSTFVGNSSVGGNSLVPGVPGGDGYGGAVSVGNGGEAKLSGNRFARNTAAGGGENGDGLGGAVMGYGGGELELSRNHFISNSAEGGPVGGTARGGAMAIAPADVPGFVPGAATVVTTRDRFVKNQAGGDGLGGGLGGGIYNEGSLTVQRGTLHGNLAEGDAASIVTVSPVANLVGGAVGGGLFNAGTLEVERSRFSKNRVVGADGADSSASAFPGPAFPGNAFGGGLANYSVADVQRSQFTGNAAEAGDGGVGDFATIGLGGGIYNDATLAVSQSKFRRNQAIGGDSGSSAFHNGHALGGAIASGSLVGGAELAVEHSSFVANVAQGGNDNVVTGTPDLPAEAVPEADAPNNGYGGAILVYEGSAEISHSRIFKNQALGGDGETFNGNLGVGGGIFLFNFVGEGVNADLKHLQVTGNRAVGGEGGDGIGGGVAVGSLDSLFIVNIGTTTISSSMFSGNAAIGGRDGGSGLGGGVANVSGGDTELSRSLIRNNKAIGAGTGDGFGGGVYNAENADLDLARDIIFRNLATGGDDGTGRGGGIYNAGTLELDRFTKWLTRFNEADEEAFDNFFGL